MPDYHFRKTDGFFSVDRFSGVDLRVRGAGDPAAARRSVNFRYTPTYGLKPRCGFSRIAALPADVRGLVSCRLGGAERLFAAAGNGLFSLGDAVPVRVGSLPRSAGEVIFFCRDGLLFLIDGPNLLATDGETLSAVGGYIPLYAGNAATGGDFTLRETPNLLTDLVRVRVHVTTVATTYLLPDEVTEIVSLTPRDGSTPPSYELLDTPDGNMRLQLEEDPPTATVYELVCRTTVSTAAYAKRTALLSASSAAIFGRVTATRIYLFSAVTPGRVFYSDKPNGNYLPYSGAPGADALYFPDGSEFLVGGGEEAVTAACRFLDRLFLFTARDAWFVSTGEPGEAKPLHSNAGCALRGGALPLDNNPVTVGRDGLYLWKQITGYSECAADFVSAAVSPELTPELLASSVCGVCRGRDELWLCPGADEGGGAWIWDYRRGLYYRFEGFLCEHFAEYGGEVVFSHGGGVFAFDEARAADDDGTGETEITALWENASCPFSGYPEKKHLRRAAFSVLPDGGEVELSVLPDNGRVCSRTDGGAVAAATDPATPLTFLFDAAAGRFYTAKLRLRTQGGRSEIRSASLGIEII